ncbi:SEC14-like protein 1 [Bagarius yarrelli]|uniref:SEC14-like protein 1 n=1 Tax=Bagarius yarrelli TaxID=175774 RepID=A0A556VX37_BAGYA|nr:SEC14-like protein 1 [Bagarius yarrelli]
MSSSVSFQLLIEIIDASSVITWDFDVCKGDVVFNIYHSKRAPQPPRKEALASHGITSPGGNNVQLIDRSWQLGQDYSMVESPLTCKEGESVQGSHVTRWPGFYILQWRFHSMPACAATNLPRVDDVLATLQVSSHKCKVMYYTEVLGSEDFRCSDERVPLRCSDVQKVSSQMFSRVVPSQMFQERVFPLNVQYGFLSESSVHFRNGSSHMFKACLQGNLIAICLEQLSDPHPLLRQWVAICLGRIWHNFDSARWCGVRASAHEKLYVRCAAMFALGTFVGNSAERTDHSTTIDHNVAMMLAQLINDGSPVVRKELVVALSHLVVQYESTFCTVALQFMEEEKNYAAPSPANTKVSHNTHNTHTHTLLSWSNNPYMFCHSEAGNVPSRERDSPAVPLLRPVNSYTNIRAASSTRNSTRPPNLPQ